jgi:hypothetical protein
MRLIAVLLLSSVVGCASTRELAAMRQVEFRFDRISDAQIAGVRLGSLHSTDDVSVLDLGRLTLAVASKDVPLDLIVHVNGLNPETNHVTARMIALDWSYFVDERETVSGRLSQSYAFPPGQSTDVPVVVTFNMFSFFGGAGKDFLDTALALAGQRASSHVVTLRLIPSVDTPAGPIRYPVPITLDLARVGGQ